MKVIAFNGSLKVAEGEPGQALPAIRAFMEEEPEAPLLVLNHQTSSMLEIDWSQPDELIERSLAYQAGEAPVQQRQGRGRPKLGVQSREVSLLPRHWEWLNRQQGGASAALRRMVEAARKSPVVQLEESSLAVDRFMQTLAGDLPRYEEALRQFYRHQYGAMFTEMADWPEDVQRHIRALVGEVQHWREANEPDRRH
ncbi:DUF2239 family protein [Saccharospirillum impatiens]|uniref:DUF2239 family protein n=1 Tax=Saccharospirillum impatiens TaxID=169438 RepID=UPI0003F74B67|nr:DUF2239 family protein [Saccharospirillum impatiens]